jgi:ClpP class serine protease
VDSSKKYEDAGLKVHVIKTGPYKAMGVPGAEITAEQISSIQQVVNGILDNFIDAVAAGRKKSAEQIRELADGRLWLADKAAKMGLADKVIRNSSQTLIEKMKGEIMESEQQQVDIQVELNEAKEKAKEQSLRDERERIKAITSEFADDAEFALEAIDKGWDVKEAKAQYCDVLKKKLAEKPQADGAEPLTENGEGGEKIVDFNEAAKALAKEEKIALGDAYKKIARQQPELYQSYRESIGLPKTG